LKCLVTGAYGFLGVALCNELERSGHTVLRAGRRTGAEIQLDPDDRDALSTCVVQHSPDVVVNLVAMTNVDECERNPAEAFQANAGVVQSICDAIDAHANTRLIHISTDQVYDGPGPHVESKVAPTNVYAITKYVGELLAERNGGTVLRVNFVGRSHASGRVGLSDWLVSSLQDHSEVTLFKDVYFSPLHVSTLCMAIERAVTVRVAGTFNVGAHGGVSKAEFGLRLARSLDLPTGRVTVGAVSERVMAARRPSDMVMNSARFERAFGFPLPSVDTEIERVAADYRPDFGENA
jgi:dTDP-4-dehydrorhamnose reductase